MGLWGPGGSSRKRSGSGGGRRGGTVGQLDLDQRVRRAAGRSTVQRTPPGGSGRGRRDPGSAGWPLATRSGWLGKRKDEEEEGMTDELKLGQCF